MAEIKTLLSVFLLTLFLPGVDGKVPEEDCPLVRQVHRGREALQLVGEGAQQVAVVLAPARGNQGICGGKWGE